MNKLQQAYTLLEQLNDQIDECTDLEGRFYLAIRIAEQESKISRIKCMISANLMHGLNDMVSEIKRND